MGIKKLSEDEDFNRFWERYPKRVAKLDALKAWKSLKPSPELVADMLEAVEQQRDSREWRKDGGQFVPYPASWIRAGRWMDETPAPRAAWTCPHQPHCAARGPCDILNRIKAGRNGHG